MVQTRWTHINRGYSFLTQVEAILLDGHFVLEHSGRGTKRGVFSNFKRNRRNVASAGHYGRRRMATHTTRSRKTRTSLTRVQLAGWKFLYLQDVECPAELPVEMTAFKDAAGAVGQRVNIQTAKKDFAEGAQK